MFKGIPPTLSILFSLFWHASLHSTHQNLSSQTYKNISPAATQKLVLSHNTILSAVKKKRIQYSMNCIKTRVQGLNPVTFFIPRKPQRQHFKH